MLAAEDIHVIHLPEHYGELSLILRHFPLQLLSYHVATLSKAIDVDLRNSQNQSRSNNG